jgi:hypothetical protein
MYAWPELHNNAPILFLTNQRLECNTIFNQRHAARANSRSNKLFPCSVTDVISFFRLHPLNARVAVGGLA